MFGRLVKSSLSKFIVLFVVSFFIVGKIKPAKKFEISFLKNKYNRTKSLSELCSMVFLFVVSYVFLSFLKRLHASGCCLS